MKFIKYRMIFACGPLDWHYSINDDDSKEGINSFKIKILNDYAYLDNHITCEVVVIKMPPKKWLQEKIEELKSEIEVKKNRILFFESIIKDAKENEII